MAMSDKKREQVMTDAAPVLMAGETVLDVTTGLAVVVRMRKTTRRRATILVTDRRVIVFSKKLGGYDAQDYAYGLLTGVDHTRGLTGGRISLRASGDAAMVQMVPRADVERVAQTIRERMAVTHNPAGGSE